MTFIGKCLVLLNAVLAVAMLIWAFALWYSQQPPAFVPQPSGTAADKATPRATDEASVRTKEELDRRVARIKALNTALESSSARWRALSGELSALEASYYAHQVFYERQLDDLENGRPTDPNQLIHRADKVKRDPAAGVQAVTWKEGRLQMNTEKGNLLYGRPIMTEAKDVAGNPIHAIPYYRPEIDRLRDKAVSLSDDMQKVSKKSTDLTAELAGDREPDPDPSRGKPLGLRRRLDADELKQRRIQDEADALADLNTKNQVDARLMVRRKRQMEERVQELKAVLGQAP